jgi:hypothetical protein
VMAISVLGGMVYCNDLFDPKTCKIKYTE